METSVIAPNHGAAAPHESDSGASRRRLVLATLLPLVLGAQTSPIKKESGGQGLAIMWRPFVRYMQQPIENCCMQSGGLWRGNMREVERVKMSLPHCIVLAIQLSDKNYDTKIRCGLSSQQTNKNTTTNQNLCWWWGMVFEKRRH
jgi:hypothetical protein